MVTLGTGSAAADIERAQAIVQGSCFVCHGAEGESSSPVFPRLAGQHAEYLVRQLMDYKTGRRKSSAMQPMVQDLTPGDFVALGRFFESRPVQQHGVEDAALAEHGRQVYQRAAGSVPACGSCHGSSGQGTPALPRLAGQHAQYIERQLKAFGSRERTNDNAVMHAVAAQLGEADAKAVAAYLSGLK